MMHINGNKYKSCSRTEAGRIDSEAKIACKYQTENDCDADEVIAELVYECLYQLGKLEIQTR